METRGRNNFFESFCYKEKLTNGITEHGVKRETFLSF